MERSCNSLRTPTFWEDEVTTAEGHGRLGVKVGGMRCSLCPELIERRLGREPGVNSVAVSPANEQALIEYDRTQLSAEDLLGTLRDLGFTVGDRGRSAARRRAPLSL